ncbi:MAG: carboxypeptidase-like regulatory domain-containing protein [Mucilaginibacter sp.]
MRFQLICLYLLLPLLSWAQFGSISGKVSQSGSKTPVARASVFLSNSSFGTVSSDNGIYTLNNVRPGQYTLVVTAIGYEDYTKTLLVGHEPLTLDIELKQQSIQLREVVISTATKADWRRNYEQFKEEFIGTDKNAKDCEVINPDVLNFTTHKSKKVLEAYADEFLVVENRALGYRVKFLVKDFKSDHISGIISYSGQRLFEELPGKASQKKKWQIKRDEAYYGSAMHFYRSLYKNKLDEDGFEIYQLRRTLNPNRPPEEVIQKHLDKLRAESNSRSYNLIIDTVRYWTDMQNLSRFYMQDISTVKYLPEEILRKTETPGIYAITFPNCLYVIYTKKREETYFKDVYRPLTMPNYETTILSFLSKEPVAFFDMNGIIVADGPLYEGTWSKSRLSTLLPVDYVPAAEQGGAKQAALPAAIQ